MKITNWGKICIAVFVVLLAFGIYQTYLKNKISKDYAEALLVNDTLNNKMKTYIDENGKLHARVETFDVDKKAYQELNKQQLDSIADVLNIKTKNINTLTSIITKTSGSIKTKIDSVSVIVDKDGKKDTLKQYQFEYNDNWLWFNGNIIDDTLYANYSIMDSLSLVYFSKNKGLFGLGKKTNYLDITSQNPNLKFVNTKNIQLNTEKPKRWNVGPYIGYGYDGIKWTPSIGISLQYGFIRF